MSDTQAADGKPAFHPARFTWPVRVYYEDTDSGGVVYYANYLKFLERARTEWLRAAGFEQAQLLRDFGVIFVVHSLAIEYRRPARFDDLLTITVVPVHIGRSRMEVEQTVERDEVLASARVRLACVEHPGFKPARIPDPIKNKIESLS